MSESHGTPPGRQKRHTGVWVLFGIAVILAAIGAASIWFQRPVTVPDVSKMVVNDANSAIKRAGLTVGSVSQVATTTISSDLVASQSPAPSTEAKRGSKVDYAVAVEPSLQAIPSVVGLAEDTAVEKLAESLYGAATIYVFDDHVKDGIVVAQTPPDRYEWTTGQPVAIAVSKGPNDGTGVAVPLVRGMSLEDAKSSLKKVGLNGEAIVANPTATYSGDVVRQLPSPDTLVPPGATVLLVFDRL